MSTLRIFLIPAVVLTLLCGCGTTHFTSTWKDPEVRAGALKGRTVATIFVSKDLSQRRAAEVYMANDLTNRGVHGVTAYTLLPDNHGDGDAAREALKAAGVDAAIVMRVAGKDQKTTYTPGTVTPAYYGGFGRYYNYGYATIYTPGSVSKDTIVSVETLIYRLKDDKLMWASMSQTTNPDNLSQLIDDTADAIAKQVSK
jgi:hypothetical protein